MTSPDRMKSAFKCAILLAVACMAVPALAIEVDCLRANPDRVVYVRVERVAVLARAEADAPRVGELQLGTYTCGLMQVEAADGPWVLLRGYMKAPDAPEFQGWVPRSAVAYQKDFKPVTAIRPQTVRVEIGDYAAEFEVRRNGTYAVDQVIGEHRCGKKEIPNEYGACEDWATVRGRLVRSGVLVLTSSKYGFGGETFLLREDGQLCPWQYGDLPEHCR